ncbi:hypothetical protein [Thermogemmatispora sp.]|uniref:hypothetical protein n=1 Tax=Thermogemmatispora sp. TaxID=1968838 RepID=UPI0035E45D35
MPTTFSYARILYAVGQVLDQIGVKSIALREEEDGLFVEGYNSNGQLQVQLRYDIPDLYELLTRVEEQENGRELPQTAEVEGLLRRFLTEHDRELVGISR